MDDAWAERGAAGGNKQKVVPVDSVEENGKGNREHVRRGKRGQ